jgi:hypothetical protein
VRDLERILAAGADAAKPDESLLGFPVRQKKEARAVVAGLAQSEAFELVARAFLFFHAGTPEARRVFAEEGLPVLREILARIETDCAFAVMLVLVEYGAADDAMIIVERLRASFEPDHALWYPVLESCAAHATWANRIIDEMGGDLPCEKLVDPCLSFANLACAIHGCAPHPFDTDAGRASLLVRLEDACDPWRSRAAAASLRFLAADGDLLRRAVVHPDPVTRIRGIAAQIARGESTHDAVADWCMDTRWAQAAFDALAAVRKREAIPHAALAAEHRASAAVCAYFLGEDDSSMPPDGIELVDRRLSAPAAFLFRCRYDMSHCLAIAVPGDDPDRTPLVVPIESERGWKTFDEEP